MGVKNRLISFLILIALAAPCQAAAPKYVFLFIGDGLGASQRQFSEYYLQEVTKNPKAKLRMNQLAVAGLNTTHAADTLVTDSAAAATALATGQKTNKGMLSISPEGRPLTTLMEAVVPLGFARGIVTTTRVTHATPAAFFAHNPSRNHENEIARDLVDSDLDFIAGGGIRHFIPQDFPGDTKDALGRPILSKRRDKAHLINELKAKGYNTFVGKAGAKAFAAQNFTRVSRVFAAFSHSNLPFEIERQYQSPDLPSLAEMTRAGIAVLEQDPDGFFLMVEGGRIDHACHANDPAATLHDVLALDRAVAEAWDFYTAHPNETLILVVGDHETGGLGMGLDVQGYHLNLAALIPVRTAMVGSRRKSGTHDVPALFHRLETQYGLANITPEESSALKKALKQASAPRDTQSKPGKYFYDPVALTASRLLSRRANIGWTATVHTATMVPLSAQGVGSQAFSGFKDNTQIARTLAKVLGVNL